MKLIIFINNYFFSKAALIFCLVFSISTYTLAQKFTIPVFPDTQDEIEYKPDMFFSQINWIKKAADSLHIPIVLHVGDITDDNTYSQWEIASRGFGVLDKADIPYALAVGNHDNHSAGEFRDFYPPENDNARVRITDEFNAYFPVHRFLLQRGRFEQEKSDNAYYTFRAGGLNWLVLVLEYLPRRSAVNWAQLIISSHPNYNVILLTHYFLDPDGTIGNDAPHGGNLSPQAINKLLVEKFHNIKMVISGHLTTSARNIGHGKQGNKVYEILQDYQGHDYGGGYLRLLTIDPSAGTISAKMYSPFYDKVLGGKSSFSFSNVNFIRKDKNEK